MARIVHVRHPAPFLHVPRGKRKARLDLRQVTTPVAVREADARAFAPVAVADLRDQKMGHVGYHAFEGALWQRLTGLSPYAGFGVPGFGADAFVRYLEGAVPLERFDRTDVGWALSRTPLCAMQPVVTGHPGAYVYDLDHPRSVSAIVRSRGEEIDPAAAREVHFDGAAQAVADLGRFMEGVVLAGNEVYVRACGPLAKTRGMSYVLHAYPRAAGDLDLPVRLDRVEEAARTQGSIWGTRDLAPSLVAFLRDAGPALAELAAPDDDVRTYLNLLPLWLARQVAQLNESGSFREDGDLVAALAAKTLALASWQVRAMTGAITVAEAEPLCLAALDLIRTAEAGRLQQGGFPLIELAAGVVEGVLLPRIRGEEAMVEDDMAALGGLRPA